MKKKQTEVITSESCHRYMCAKGAGGLWAAYSRLPKETRLRLGCAGILFSLLGIVASPGESGVVRTRTRVMLKSNQDSDCCVCATQRA